LVKLEWELNYLNTETHTLLLRRIKKPQTIILWFWYTCVIDNDAAEELDIVIQEYMQQGKQVYITWLEDQNLALMSHGAWYTALVKAGNIYESKTKLLEILLD
jgi:MFS superfamily sulfate permease-like transporter